MAFRNSCVKTERVMRYGSLIRHTFEMIYPAFTKWLMNRWAFVSFVNFLKLDGIGAWIKYQILPQNSPQMEKLQKSWRRSDSVMERPRFQDGWLMIDRSNYPQPWIFGLFSLIKNELIAISKANFLQFLIKLINCK